MTSNRPERHIEILNEHRALAVLRFLVTTQGYTLNDGILKDALQAIGIPTFSEDIAECLEMLKAKGLVRVELVEDIMRVKVVTLTENGVYVAEGRKSAEGVARYFPSN